MPAIAPDELIVNMADPHDLEHDLADHQIGQIAVWNNASGVGYGAVVRSTISPEDLSDFRTWASTALNQLLETLDPIANGWYPSTLIPGGWHMKCSRVLLPNLGAESAPDPHQPRFRIRGPLARGSAWWRRTQGI